MKIIVFVTHMYLVISCCASVYDEATSSTERATTTLHNITATTTTERPTSTLHFSAVHNFTAATTTQRPTTTLLPVNPADVTEALQNRGVVTFTNKPGLFTAILKEADKHNISELEWNTVKANGTTLSHPQDSESLGKLIGLFTGKFTDIHLYNTAEVGSVMANIVNNVPHMEEVTDIAVDTDNMYVSLSIGHERQRAVMIYGYYDSSFLTSTVTQFIEKLTYRRGLIKMLLLYTALTPTLYSTIDRMRENGVLGDDVEMTAWNDREDTYKTIPWNSSQKTHDWSVLQ